MDNLLNNKEWFMGENRLFWKLTEINYRKTCHQNLYAYNMTRDATLHEICQYKKTPVQLYDYLRIRKNYETYCKNNILCNDKSPSSIIIDCMDFSNINMEKLLSCLVYGKSKSYISNCSPHFMEFRTKALEHLFNHVEITSEMVDKFLTCYNVNDEYYGKRYFDWINILKKKDYQFTIDQINKMLALNVPISYINYVYPIDILEQKLLTILPVDLNSNLYLLVQNKITDICIHNLLTSRIINMINMCKYDYRLLHKYIIQKLTIMFDKEATLQYDHIISFINHFNYPDDNFCYIFRFLLSHITLNEEQIINIIDSLLKKKFVSGYHLKFSIMCLVFKTGMYTKEILCRGLSHPFMIGDNKNYEINVDDINEIELNHSIGNFDFYQFLKTKLIPDADVLYAVIPDVIFIDNEVMTTPKSLYHCYIMDIVNSFHVEPNKKCLDKVASLIDLEMIDMFLLYKIQADDDTFDCLMKTVDFKNGQGISMSELECIVKSLYTHGMTMTYDKIKRLFKYIQLENLEQFNIPYDNKIYALCHILSKWPLEYYNKFQINNKIIIMRDLCLVTPFISILEKYITENNLQLDRYCLENMAANRVIGVHEKISLLKKYKLTHMALINNATNPQFSHFRKRLCPYCCEYKNDCKYHTLSVNIYGVTGVTGATGPTGVTGATGIYSHNYPVNSTLYPPMDNYYDRRISISNNSNSIYNVQNIHILKENINHCLYYREVLVQRDNSYYVLNYAHNTNYDISNDYIDVDLLEKPY